MLLDRFRDFQATFLRDFPCPWTVFWSFRATFLSEFSRPWTDFWDFRATFKDFTAFLFRWTIARHVGRLERLTLIVIGLLFGNSKSACLQHGFCEIGADRSWLNFWNSIYLLYFYSTAGFQCPQLRKAQIRCASY